MPATMRAEELIAAVYAAGGTIRGDGDMIELAAPRPLSPDLVARIRGAKPALLSALGEAPKWRACHREALAYWGALHPAEEAAQIAWGEIVDRWHRLHGERAPEWQCAGCGEPIDGFEELTLGDDNRVHLGDSLDCLLSFGDRWRREATTGLQALGLDRPPEFKPL
jgi:hypothetical protein